MRFSNLSALGAFGLRVCLGGVSVWSASAASAPPFDPTQFELDPQIEITRWAAEPDVVDPVALCFDESGRAFVAECRDYPYGVGPDGAVNSTVRLLEDLDGDGRPERSTVFADQLSYVTSVTPWRGGVLVAAAPDILFLKDNNGDGKADVRQVVLTGFKRGVSDSLVNSLRYHLDGRIHGANGGNNGVVSSPRWRGEDKERGPIDLRGHDFSFDPDTGTLELTGQTGGGFGRVFDDLGRAFTTYNINHIQYCFLPRRYFERYAGLPGEHLTGSISDHEEMSRIYPISEARTRPNHPEQSGHFSAAGGMGYLGTGRWPVEYQGSVLVCDVVGNLIHRDVLRPTQGGGFVASRATNEMTREFLASRDPDFRPVGVECGPDGALYVLAMQRSVIEHPDYIPEAVRAKLDVRAGADRGRIYRLAPRGIRPLPKVDLGRMKSLDLVPLLAHEDVWWRYTAQRLLHERQGTDVEAALRQLAGDTRSPLGRIHALWTMQALGLLRAGEIIPALRDGNPGVRENALLLAEPLLEKESSLAGPVLALLMDPNPRVRFQAIMTAGLGLGDRAAGPLSNLLRFYSGDSRIRLAILAAMAPGDLTMVLQSYLRDNQAAMAQAGPVLVVFHDVADLIGARSETRPADLETLIKRISLGVGEVARTALLTGIIDGIERVGAKPKLTQGARTALSSLATRAPVTRLPLVWRLSRLCGQPDSPALLAALPAALVGATNTAASLTNRLAHLALAGLDPTPAGRDALLQCLSGTETAEIQAAAFFELQRRSDPTLGAELVARWRALGPGMRGTALQWILSRRAWHGDLVAAWEKGTLTVGELNLDLEQRRRLLQGGAPELQSRVAKFIGDGEYANRAGRVSEWLAKLPPQGDAVAGRKVFEADCAKCHRGGGVGRNVGPDLSSVVHRSVEDLLANILDPNMAVNPGFVAYVAETQGGETHTGLLLSQDAAAVNLVQADEHVVSLPRKNLIKLQSSGRSLMPEGLEQTRSPQELRDLIAFLQAKK